MFHKFFLSTFQIASKMEGPGAERPKRIKKLTSLFVDNEELDKVLKKDKLKKAEQREEKKKQDAALEKERKKIEDDKTRKAKLTAEMDKELKRKKEEKEKEMKKKKEERGRVGERKRQTKTENTLRQFE